MCCYVLMSRKDRQALSHVCFRIRLRFASANFIWAWSHFQMVVGRNSRLEKMLIDLALLHDTKLHFRCCLLRIRWRRRIKRKMGWWRSQGRHCHRMAVVGLRPRESVWSFRFLCGLGSKVVKRLSFKSWAPTEVLIVSYKKKLIRQYSIVYSIRTTAPLILCYQAQMQTTYV